MGETEEETVGTVSEMMATVLDALDYDNLDRIWLDRRVKRADSVSDREATFELQVVRPGGVSDTIGNLSASERGVVGVVVATAGYIVFDVNNSVPMLALDAVEALNAVRLRNLLQFLRAHTDYLLATAHPEDEPLLSDESVSVVDVNDIT